MPSLFSLTFKQNADTMYIKMQTPSHIINTKDFPDTTKILRKLCPRVLKTKCFNDQNLPFREEVKHTEIGHLFEHIVLAYLSQLYSSQGILNVTFNGQTSWDWNVDAKGTFHVYVTPVNMVPGLLQEAIHKAIVVTEFILKSRSFEEFSQQLIS